MIQGKVNEYLSRAEVLKSHLSNSSEKSPVGLANGNGTAATKKLVETNIFLLEKTFQTLNIDR